MARLTDKDRELILADYHTGHYTQRELSRKYEVSTATINKLTKGIEPKHTDKVNAIVKATRELSAESEQEVNAVQKVIDIQVKRENLIFGNAEKLAGKLNAMADQIDAPMDMKILADANDRLAVTLKVAERHAPKAMTAIQVNTEEREVKQGIGELYKVMKN